jgi:hypothetical protein
MRTLKQSVAGAVLMMAAMIAWDGPVLAGEKIEITPSSPASKASSPLAPRMSSKLDFDLDNLEGPRIQTLQPGAPRMPVPAPNQNPSADKKNKDWLLESVAGDKPLDYNRVLGVRDYSTRANQDSSRALGQSIVPTRQDGFSGRNDLNTLDSSRREMQGHGLDRSSYLERSSARNNSLADNLGGPRTGTTADYVPSLPRTSDRDLEQFRNRSALKAEVDAILSRPESRFSNPLGNSLSVESILRPPGTPLPASARPTISQPTIARPSTAPEIPKPVAAPRELSPAAAFAKENADSLQSQRPKVSEPARRNDEPRYRPAVLPIPKRGF